MEDACAANRAFICYGRRLKALLRNMACDERERVGEEMWTMQCAVKINDQSAMLYLALLTKTKTVLTNPLTLGEFTHLATKATYFNWL